MELISEQILEILKDIRQELQEMNNKQAEYTRKLTPEEKAQQEIDQEVLVSMVDFLDTGTFGIAILTKNEYEIYEIKTSNWSDAIYIALTMYLALYQYRKIKFYTFLGISDFKKVYDKATINNEIEVKESLEALFDVVKAFSGLEIINITDERILPIRKNIIRAEIKRQQERNK